MWANWMAAVLRLRPAFSRLKTFQWFVMALAAMSIRKDHTGVTKLICTLNINPKSYTRLLNFYQSEAVELKRLIELWVSLALDLFAEKLFLIKGRPVFLGDGIKIPKEGKRMPAVKKLHQSSQSNSKAEWIWGHSLQAVSLLIAFSGNAVAVPLTCMIHEGLRSGPRDRKTLTQKFFDLVTSLGIDTKKMNPILVADAYYCCGSLAKSLLNEGISLVTRVRKNAVAYFPPPKYSGKGRPAKYGEKIKIWNLFSKLTKTMKVSIYSDKGVTIKYGIFDLMWKSYGGLARFCLIDHPTRGKIILLTPDLTLEVEDILAAYSNRFKIEYSFKELVHTLGGFGYRFWTKAVKKTQRKKGDFYTHRESRKNKEKIARKMFSYHFYIHMALIAQGLLHYLSVCHSKVVWSSFRGWLRTIRPGIPASCQVVKECLSDNLGNFRESLPKDSKWRKFAKSIWDSDPPYEERDKNAA